MAEKNDDITLRIATIKRDDRGRAKNRTIGWLELCGRLSEPVIDRETSFARYSSLSANLKAPLKDHGAFVGGQFKDNVRRATNITERSLISLDVDDCTQDQIDQLKLGLSKVCKYEFFASTTRSHSPEAQRWRIIFPLAEEVSADRYGPCSIILASRLFKSVSESMDAVDTVSFRVAQIMYWPSICHDGVFESFRNEGELLDSEALLKSYPGCLCAECRRIPSSASALWLNQQDLLPEG